MTSGTPGTITVPAEASTSRPYGVCRLAPPTTGTGPGRSAQTLRSYQVTSSSGRGRPNTSVTIPVSKTDMPGYASTATVRSTAAPEAWWTTGGSSSRDMAGC